MLSIGFFFLQHLIPCLPYELLFLPWESTIRLQQESCHLGCPSAETQDSGIVENRWKVRSQGVFNHRWWLRNQGNEFFPPVIWNSSWNVRYFHSIASGLGFLPSTKNDSLLISGEGSWRRVNGHFWDHQNSEQRPEAMWPWWGLFKNRWALQP